MAALAAEVTDPEERFFRGVFCWPLPIQKIIVGPFNFSFHYPVFYSH
jgi:hypothetical protein